MRPLARRNAPARRGSGIRAGEARAGWVFVSPVVLVLGVFLVVPMLMALWVSVSDWGGRGSPFSSDVSFIGLGNYASVLTDGGLAERDFATSLRNSLWYTLLVVPVQTVVSLMLAVLVNREDIRGRGLFRTAYYFPSVTSTVAITVLWLFLFNATGAVNRVLSWLGINGPNWFNDPTGILLGLQGSAPPRALTEHGFLSLSWSQWLAGPSPAMTALMIMAVFTTSGTFMLLFLSALQALDPAVTEAAMVDGANGWQRLRHVTIPQLRPTIFTVVTLGVIGCWQVFDQIYTGTDGGPGKSTLTPAYLSYASAFQSQQWGRGAAIAFILFVIIIVMTLVQNAVLSEKGARPRRGRRRPGPAPAPQREVGR
jgi:multiple sugar transport system permease protein